MPRSAAVCFCEIPRSRRSWDRIFEKSFCTEFHLVFLKIARPFGKIAPSGSTLCIKLIIFDFGENVKQKTIQNVYFFFGGSHENL